MNASKILLPKYHNHFFHFEKFATEIQKYELTTPELAQKNKEESIDDIKKQLIKAKTELSIAFSNKEMEAYNLLVYSKIPELEQKLEQAENNFYSASEAAIGFKQLAQQALDLRQTGNLINQEKVRVAIIGDFSSGKSSFINSLLGEVFCPVDVAASTSSITSFKYGDVKRIFCVNGSSKTEISLEDYKKIVTHQGQSGQKYQFDVFYPFNDFRDLELFDTPGFNNSNNNEDEKITLQKCQIADVIFFVFDINKGDIGDDIKNKLLAIKNANSSLLIYGIINKSDQKPPVKIREIEQQLIATNLFADVVAYSSKKELEKYQKINFNHITEALDYINKKIAASNQSQWLITKENVQISVSELSKSLSESRNIIHNWFETIHHNKNQLLIHRLDKKIQEYNESAMNMIAWALGYIEYYTSIQEESYLSTLEMSDNEKNENIEFIKESLKTHLKLRTIQQQVSKEEKYYLFEPYYKNLLSGFDSSTNNYNSKQETNKLFSKELNKYYSKLSYKVRKNGISISPAQVAINCDKQLTEILNNYRIDINKLFETRYFDNPVEAENFLNLIATNSIDYAILVNKLLNFIEISSIYTIHEQYAKEINNILINALSLWQDDIRDYESANNGYFAAKNEAALLLKQELQDFYQSFV